MARFHVTFTPDSQLSSTNVEADRFEQLIGMDGWVAFYHDDQLVLAVPGKWLLAIRQELPAEAAS